MICGLCGYEFTEDQAQAACEGCPMGSCNLLCCPRCGYEMPREPRWIKRLRELLERRRQKRATK
jgi:hypothetical protein